MSDRKRIAHSRREFIRGATVASAALATSGTAPLLADADGERRDGALQGKVALVTGAARGIGLAISEAYVREGASVVMFDLADPTAVPEVDGFRIANEAEFDAAVDRVRAISPNVRKFKGDVRNLEDLERAVALAQREFGRLDIAVANAGYVRWHSFAEGTSLDWESVYGVNVFGVFHTFKAAIPALRAQGGGRLIALSSIGGRQGVPGNGAYTSTKRAVIGLTKQAALELGPDGIAVNAIAPGPIDTPMYRSVAQKMSMGIDAKHMSEAESDAAQDALLAPMLPLGGRAVLDPTEIADAAVYLAGDGAGSISGQTLDVALGYNANYTA